MRDTRGFVCALLCAGVMAGCLAQDRTATKAVVPAGMVLVQGGSLTNIGNGAITVDSFHISKYEVTWAEWQTVRDWATTNGYDIGSVGAGSATNHPVHSVNWYDCVKWCNARSQMEGRTPVYTTGRVIYKSGQTDDVAVNEAATGYRLPLGSEWEFAARGGTKSLGYGYSGGNDLNAVAWYEKNSSDRDQAVGTKSANELGLYDMSGNIDEWCFDRLLGVDGSFRMGRGGCWAGLEFGCRLSFGGFDRSDARRLGMGVRVILPRGKQ